MIRSPNLREFSQNRTKRNDLISGIIVNLITIIVLAIDETPYQNNLRYYVVGNLCLETPVYAYSIFVFLVKRIRPKVRLICDLFLLLLVMVHCYWTVNGIILYNDCDEECMSQSVLLSRLTLFLLIRSTYGALCLLLVCCCGAWICCLVVSVFCRELFRVLDTAEARQTELETRHVELEASPYSGEEDECAICKENLEKDVMSVQLTCGHVYHEDCIKNWYSVRQTCPVCRSPATN